MRTRNMGIGRIARAEPSAVALRLLSISTPFDEATSTPNPRRFVTTCQRVYTVWAKRGYAVHGPTPTPTVHQLQLPGRRRQECTLCLRKSYFGS